MVRDIRFIFTMTADERAMLKRMAAEQARSESSMLRYLLIEAAKKQHAQKAESSERVAA